MQFFSLPASVDAAYRWSKQHAPTLLATAAVQAAFVGFAVGFGPQSAATMALLLYLSLESAILLVELVWVWNPGSCTSESYASIVGLAKLCAVSLVVYGCISALLLKYNVTGCFLLLVLCFGAREMGHEMLHFSKEGSMKTRAAGSFLGAFSVALAICGLIAFAYCLSHWALLRGRPVADQVLFALLAPVMRLFVLLSAQRYLAKQLLRRGLLDALTLYAELSIAVHLAIDVPFFLALLVFGGTWTFALALVVTFVTDVSYVHALQALQQDTDGPGVTFALQRPSSVFAALVSGSLANDESAALLSSTSKNVSSAVTASMGDKDCVRPIGARVAALLDEYHELQRSVSSKGRVWQLQELKAATSAHTVAAWCACVSATLLFALSPTVRVAAQLPGNWSMALRCIALFLVRGAADALMVRELRAHLGDVALAAGPIDGLSIAFHAASFAVCAAACLAVL
jgi:hypothetical protein